MSDLSERQERILAFVVQEYVENAQPVGSETLRRRGLGVSSATIRNDLAELEELGYLTHPHTSAGRTPTEKGYRYFVESLMDEFELPPVEQRMISHQFHQVTLDVDQWMRLSAAVLAHASHSAALVTAPQASDCRYKHVQLVSISDQVALLVLVLQDGTIKQQMIALSDAVMQEEMGRVCNRLNDHFAGLEVEQIASTNLSLSSFETGVVHVVIDLMKQIDLRSSHDVYRDGIMDILRQPEFSAIGRMQALLEILEQRPTLEQMLSDLAPERGVQVVIGGESQYDGMSGYSMVLSRYGLPGEASGVVSVLGPLRMHYPRTIGVVRYVASLLDDLMSRMYGKWPAR
ncbi:MAG: heat-inducible transcriptional repressor HrcA [Chloroflexi bacterium]|nr:heat-inducible transcriptional repressor HrcA [Chloroflexota bacterium]